MGKVWGRVMAGKLRGTGRRSMVHPVYERMLGGARGRDWAREAVEERLLQLLLALDASQCL